MKSKWEMICYDDNYSTTRLKCFGGWVVRYECYDDGLNRTSVALVFTPDPQHEWDIGGIWDSAIY